MNYYELLEVTPNASAEVIKNAYKTLAKKFHPDTYGGDRTFAEEKMKLLNEAIAVLGNEEKRKLYNEENNIGIYSSMTTVFSSPNSTDAFIEEIDNFLNKKTKRAGKSESEKEKESYSKINIDTSGIDTDMNMNMDIGAEEDDADNIGDGEDEYDEYEENPAMNYTEEEIRNIISNEYYEGEDDDADNEIEEYKRKLKKSRRRSNAKVGKWYYITVCVMIALNILLVFLITRILNFGNIKSFFSAGVADAGNIDGENEFETEYNLENAGGTDDETPETEIATEPSIEGDYALAIPEGIPIPLSGEEDVTEKNVTLPPETQASATKAPIKTPVPVPTQKPTAAPAPITPPATVAVTAEATTEAQVADVTVAEEPTEETIEQDTTVAVGEPETQQTETEENITTEPEIETSEPETVSPVAQPEDNTEPVTEPATEPDAATETQGEPITDTDIKSEVDIVEH